MINMFYKSRDKLLKNREGMSVIIYFTLLFTIDYLGFMDLYDQNIIRRVINMRRRIDPLSYTKKIKPFCKKYEKMLDKNDISKLQSIKITDDKDFGFFGLLTRRNTTTNQCCDGWSKEEENTIIEISEKVRKMYEQRIGKKLYDLQSSKNATIYRYHGSSSHHLWHVDPQNISTIYNVIICIKKEGEISPLECKNEKGDVNSIHFEEGDAALFNGGTTVHQVPPNNDPNSERTVLSLSFTSDESLSKKNRGDNLCTFLEGGNNYLNIFKILMIVFIINIILSQLSGINSLSYKSLIIFFGFNLLIAKYIPYYFDIGLGTNRTSSIYHNLVVLLFFIMSTISIKGAIVFFSYFLLSDIFFARSWVEYD